jgi:uncharacterized protein
MRGVTCFVISVDDGHEVIDTLTRELADRGVTSAAIVSVIGAIEGCTISVMPSGNASRNILTDYKEPFEISGAGEVVDGNVHVHVAAGGEGGTVSGHLPGATVRTWFVRAYVQPLSGWYDPPAPTDRL